MIVSHAHRFVFFHNPKAGGTSVRKAIERFNDIGFGLWGVDASQTGGVAVDRAHLGIDEFRRYYPDLWDRAQGYRLISLRREPVARFLSSVSQHSKIYGREDLRFAAPGQARAILMQTLERLADHGCAEAPSIMDELSLTHFRPQWIYGHSADGKVVATVFGTNEMDRFLGSLAQAIGEPLEARHENAARSYRLPAPLRRLSQARGLRQAAMRLPGLRAVGERVKERYAAGPGRGLSLAPEDRAAVEAFVARFYARDLADLTPGLGR